MSGQYPISTGASQKSHEAFEWSFGFQPRSNADWNRQIWEQQLTAANPSQQAQLYDNRQIVEQYPYQTDPQQQGPQQHSHMRITQYSQPQLSGMQQLQTFQRGIRHPQHAAMPYVRSQVAHSMPLTSQISAERRQSESLPHQSMATTHGAEAYPIHPGTAVWATAAIPSASSARLTLGTQIPAPQIDLDNSYESSGADESSDALATSSDNLDLTRWGLRNGDGTWRCAFGGCTSRATFTRGCDLRKHYKRHSKFYFCRLDSRCSQRPQSGFSSRKDRDRHEQSHTPGVACEWDGCDRVFSRTDNMKDHVRRVHRKGNRSSR